MLLPPMNYSVDGWIAACVICIITTSFFLTYYTVRNTVALPLQTILEATPESVSEMIQDRIQDSIQTHIQDRIQPKEAPPPNLHVVPMDQGITYVKRPDSPQNIHPSQIPVQTAEQAIQLMRSEQERATPPIKLIRIQNYTKVNTLYISPSKGSLATEGSYKPSAQ